MQIQDLEEIGGPVLLFGGVYGNLQALEAVLDVAHRLGAVPVCTGATGMPPNGGRPETCYAVLSKGGLRFARLEYDHNAAASAMRSAGLVQGYERAVASGRWPSEDVLPQTLRRAVS